MKQLILKERKSVEFIDKYDEVVQKNQVRIKMIASGICGTDKFFYFKSNEPVIYWGHEVLGVIVECGENVSKDLLGKHVLTKTTYHCGKCKYCNRGEHDKCSCWTRYSYNGFSNEIVISQNLIVVLENKKFLLEYVLAEPLNVALDIVKKIKASKSDNLVVCGLGPIGLFVIFLLKKYGFENIYAIGKEELELKNKLAIEWGAKEVYYTNDVEKLYQRFDVGVITTPYKTIEDFSKLICYGGNIIFNGIHEQHVIPMNMHYLHFQKISLIPSFPHPQNNFGEAISIIEQYNRELSNIISHKISFNTCDKDFSILIKDRTKVLKVVITNQETIK